MYQITLENYGMINRECVYTGGLKYNYVQDLIVMKRDDDRS